MKVKYTGPDPDGVFIPDLGNLHCPHGDVVDVPDAVGENLLLQHYWEAAPEPKAKEAKS